MEEINKESNYWEMYYSKDNRTKLIPSQFAVYIASEFQNTDVKMIEFGCGNGRDSNFFSGIGFKVLGIDASEEAINIANSNSNGKAKFISANLKDPKLQNIIDSFVGDEDKHKIIIYSRFFLHAIDEKTEESLWELIKKLSNLVVALEFRTMEDEYLSKNTDEHYRRYIDTYKFRKKINDMNYKCTYHHEGFGMAKFKQDDAHVARFVLEK